ncbi:hypothetical protein PIB30_056991 [Stylosanthes scabra]|uniref:Uncharacterized protein n=1 Tax=Stylosanthes scabra TaxID=79078 RepID=A0ABU6UN29_9FABA|nr:hypothetical protein [Stylosanthes scabra]
MVNETMYFPYQNTARQFKEMEMQGIPVTIANLAIHRHREEEMNQKRMRHDQMVQEATAERASEANKGKAREVVPDFEEEEDSEELTSSASEEWKEAWSFISRGNDTHFTVVLLIRFGALAEIGAYQKVCSDCVATRHPLVNDEVYVEGASARWTWRWRAIACCVLNLKAKEGISSQDDAYK